MIRVTDVVVAPLHAVTQRDAIAEGHRTTDDFFKLWDEIYGHRPRFVWVISLELVKVLPLRPARFLAPGSGYTTVQGRSIDREATALDEDELAAAVAAAKADAHPVGRRPVSRVAPLRPDAMACLEEELQRGLLAMRGLDPDTVHERAPEQGSPGDVRARRRRMGLRAVDGLEPRSLEADRRVMAMMLTRGCSVRDLARAMDWSHGKANNVIRAHRGAAHPGQAAA